MKKIGGVTNRKLYRYILACFVLLIINVFNLLQVQATPPSIEAPLLFVTGESVSSKMETVLLLRHYQKTLIEKLSRCQPSICITLPEKPKNWKDCYIEINHLEFLFEYVNVEEGRKGYGPDKVYVPGEGRLFEVFVPVVLKGSNYKIINGEVIVRVDKMDIDSLAIGGIIDKDGRTIYLQDRPTEEIPQRATKMTFFVDEAGSVYCGCNCLNYTTLLK